MSARAGAAARAERGWGFQTASAGSGHGLRERSHPYRSLRHHGKYTKRPALVRDAAQHSETTSASPASYSCFSGPQPFSPTRVVVSHGC